VVQCRIEQVDHAFNVFGVHRLDASVDRSVQEANPRIVS
jgi:hypothetical protein